MTKEYTVVLTDAEEKALTSVVLSVQDWVDNALHERSRLAIEGVVAVCVEKCLETSTAVPGSKDAMVDLAFERGWVKTAAQQNADAQLARGQP